MPIDRDAIRRAAADVESFAHQLLGERLWPHQLQVLRSPARVSCICSGRQAGKSRTLAVAALHEAYTASDRRVLVLSAGEEASKDLLAEIARLASAPLLAGSMVDESRSSITLSNGSSIRSVPASEKQVRGRAVDLLVLDEAAYIDDALWTAARFTIIARPGSRVLMASTPFGRADRFFAVAFRAGERGEQGYESFHWPSTVSPLVDTELLELWRTTSTDREYRREVQAEWVDDQGAYFTADEIEGSIDDYELIEPDHADSLRAICGLDWGFAHDASALVAVSLDDHDRVFVPYLEEHHGLAYARFIERVAEIDRGYRFMRVVSECNGVGAMPTQTLAEKLGSRVVGVHTTNESKENGFGAVKLLAQNGRLRLPRHPGLLGQLTALEFETRDNGLMHIAVPERAGHDDLAMALCLAMSDEPMRRLRPAESGSAVELMLQLSDVGMTTTWETPSWW